MTEYQPYTVFPKPIPIPAKGATTAPFVCVRFSRAWLPAILGALGALLQRRSWVGNETQQILATREAMNLITLFMRNECGEMAIDDIRLVDCILEYHMDNEWFQVGNIADCSADALAAAQAAQADADAALAAAQAAQAASDSALAKLEEVTQPPLNETNDTTDKMSCGVADFVTTYTMDKWTDVLDQLHAAILLATTGAKVVADIVNTVAQFTVIGDEVIDGVNELVTGTTQTICEELIAQDTVEFRADMKCALYELLKQNGGSFGDLRSVVADDWTQWISDNAPIPSKMFLTIFVGFLSIQYFQRLERISANNTGECDDCNEWCYTFDFTQTNHGFGLVALDQAGYYGTWQNGVGWIGGAVSCGKQFEQAFTLTGVSVQRDTPNCGIGFYVTDDDSFPANEPQHFLSSKYWTGSAPFTHNYEPPLQVPAWSYLNVATTWCNEEPHAIQRLTLYGTGTCPFGEPNCA